LGDHPPPNVAGGRFRVEQGGYLAGYLAALMERRRRGRDAVGSVGGFRVPAVVDPFIAGYQAGAKEAVPGVTTVNEWARSFLNPAKCRAAALGEIAEGAGVVFPVAGLCGSGALEAAKERGVWGIGVDVDQSYLGPHILTSVVKRIDLALYGAVKRLVRGNFRTGVDTVFDLRNGGVELGRISPKVPPRFRIRLEEIRRAIVAGRIEVPNRLKPESRG
jgi:basic membrane protein A